MSRSKTLNHELIPNESLTQLAFFVYCTLYHLYLSARVRVLATAGYVDPWLKALFRMIRCQCFFRTIQIGAQHVDVELEAGELNAVVSGYDAQ